MVGVVDMPVVVDFGMPAGLDFPRTLVVVEVLAILDCSCCFERHCCSCGWHFCMGPGGCNSPCNWRSRHGHRWLKGNCR